jgi:cytochrome oxidase Cu insertion factor (SCO1/SenC/PrrC family)
MSSSILKESPERVKRKAQRTLLLIFAICIAPFVAATIVFIFFPPDDRLNYGDLLEPTPVSTFMLQREGKAFTLAELKGKWVMLHFDSGECAAVCETKLFNMRQSRTAQGREMDRIERVWVRADTKQPDVKLEPLYTGVHRLDNPSPEFVAAFPATTDVRAHIYLIDPLGNLMLRYPPDADPKRIIKDLARLLKVSRVG